MKTHNTIHPRPKGIVWASLFAALLVAFVISGGLMASNQLDETMASLPAISGINSIKGLDSLSPLPYSAEVPINETLATTSTIHLPIIFRAIPAPLLQATSPSINNVWTLSWNAVDPSVTSYRLQESLDMGFTSGVTDFVLGGNVTSRQIQHSPPGSAAYYYRVRAEINGNLGLWSNIVTVLTFSDLNLQTTLPDDDNEWTASWNSGGAGIAFYELQESRTANFSNIIQIYNTGTAISRKLSHSLSEENIYYYRVRGIAGGNAGPWSNTVMVIGGYRDSFDSDINGWEMRRSDDNDFDISHFDDDQIRLKLDEEHDYLLVSPLAMAPELNFEIEVEAKFSNPEHNDRYGIIFGGDWNGSTCPNNNQSSCFNSYYLLRVRYQSIGIDTFLEYKLKRIDGHDSDNHPYGDTLIDWHRASSADSDGWNTWAIKVETDNDIKIYLDGTRLDSERDDDMPDPLNPYFGLMIESKEDDSLAARFDKFRIRRD